MTDTCCIVSNFYIKSQLKVTKEGKYLGCIVSNFYIKSQLGDKEIVSSFVV